MVEVFEAYEGFYRYQHLPKFAQLVLSHHLNDFVQEQLILSSKLQLPLLEVLSSRFSEEEIVQFSLLSAKEYLNYLVHNRVYEQIHDYMMKWLNDQLGVVGKFQVVIKDITLVNYVREQAFKKFIPLYTTDIYVALELTSELDRLFLSANTTATNTFINILEQKIKDESLFNQKLLEASPAIIFVFDLIKNKEVFVSGKVRDVLGYTPEELLAMSENVLFQLTHPDDLPILEAHLQELISQNNDKMCLLEYRFKHKDGNYRWLRTYEVIFKRDSSGKPVELLGTTFEITREKQIALALEKREQQLLEAQSIAHIGSYEWNIAENRSSNTLEVFRIFEMSHEQRFEDFMSYVHPEDVQKVKEAIEKSFNTGAYECEYRYIKNGKEKVIWSVGRVEFENQKPSRMLGTVQDVTKIKNIERELIQKTKQLERSNEGLQQFASIASHDMKEPLRKNILFIDKVLTLEKENLSTSSVEYLLKIQRSSWKMRQMIDDILSFSIFQGREEKKWYSLQTIVEEVADLLEQNIKEKRATLIYADLPNAYIIPTQFRQLLQNLIANSLKFSKPDVPPKIEITHNWLKERIDENLKPADRYLQLTIKDNGIGFSNEYKEKVFELFKRLHAKTQYEGSGLGLAIAKRIIENHEGIITAESLPGEGATFTILFPQ